MHRLMDVVVLVQAFHEVHFSVFGPSSALGEHPNGGPCALCAFQFGAHLHFSVTHGKLVFGVDAGGQIVGGVVGQYAVVLYAVQHQFTFLQFI